MYQHALKAGKSAASNINPDPRAGKKGHELDHPCAVQAARIFFYELAGHETREIPLILHRIHPKIPVTPGVERRSDSMPHNLHPPLEQRLNTLLQRRCPCFREY